MQENVWKVKENDTQELSNSMFPNVITSSFFMIFLKLFREELLAGFFQFRVAWEFGFFQLGLNPGFKSSPGRDTAQDSSRSRHTVNKLRKSLRTLLTRKHLLLLLSSKSRPH